MRKQSIHTESVLNSIKSEKEKSPPKKVKYVPWNANEEKKVAPLQK